MFYELAMDVYHPSTISKIDSGNDSNNDVQTGQRQTQIHKQIRLLSKSISSISSTKEAKIHLYLTLPVRIFVVNYGCTLEQIYVFSLFLMGGRPCHPNKNLL
jgi:hypothetical protein